MHVSQCAKEWVGWCRVGVVKRRLGRWGGLAGIEEDDEVKDIHE